MRSEELLLSFPLPTHPAYTWRYYVSWISDLQNRWINLEPFNYNLETETDHLIDALEITSPAFPPTIFPFGMPPVLNDSPNPTHAQAREPLCLPAGSDFLDILERWLWC